MPYDLHRSLCGPGRASMKRLLLVLCLVLFVTACGFHLRGYQQRVSSSVSSVYISDTAAAGVAGEVASQMAESGARIAKEIDGAEYLVRLEREKFDQTVLSVSAATGKVEEYELTVTVFLTLLDAKGRELISAEKIRGARDYTFDEDAVLGKFEEEDVLREELLAQVASEIVRRVNAEVESD